jgi:hypothetical protein
VSIRFRADLEALLTEFVEQHRGVRLGRMFGWPAGYVGRRLFACVIRDGVIVRLPADVERRELRGRARPFVRAGKPMKSWVVYRPRTVSDSQRLAPVLELAARHVAQTQMTKPPRPKGSVRP